MTQRWKLTIEYDGTDFCGWQRQEDIMSVQQAIEDAIEKFCGEEVRLHVAGRTDAGVHATGQVAHVDIERVSTEKEVRDAINHHIHPYPVAVVKAEPVDQEFHARFGAKHRAYCYKIVAGRSASTVLCDRRVWHVKHTLDVEAMHRAAQYLVGHHDFSSFRDSECQAKDALRTMDRLDVVEVENPLMVGQHIEIWAEAKSFLHHQIRNITGTLKAVGEGKLMPEDVKTILEAKDRCKAGVTAPAAGLYFIKVDY